MKALLHDRREAALCLLESAGARCNVNARRCHQGLEGTAIHLAAQSCNAEIVRSTTHVTHEHHTDFDNARRCIPVIICCFQVKQLLQLGADVSALDGCGRYPSRHCHNAVLRLIGVTALIPRDFSLVCVA